MKKLSILLAVFLLFVAGQAFALPYEPDDLNKKTASFEITFNEDAEVSFKFTIDPEKEWEDGGYLYYKVADNEPIAVFLKDDHKIKLDVDYFGYRTGQTLELYAENLKFKVKKLSNDIKPQVPEPATMLLLGVGLIGLAGFRRNNIIKRNKS